MGKQISKWVILTTDENNAVSYRKNAFGGRVIEIRKEFDTTAKQVRYAVIWYKTKGENIWGGFVADYVYSQDLAIVCANHWMKENGYDYD